MKITCEQEKPHAWDECYVEAQSRPDVICPLQKRNNSKIPSHTRFMAMT